MTSDTSPDAGHARSTESSESSKTSKSSSGCGAGPGLTIVSGQPTPEETAAVVVVLTALASQGDAAPPARPAPSQWSARSRFMRAPVRPGPDAWRASALPR